MLFNGVSQLRFKNRANAALLDCLLLIDFQKIPKPEGHSSPSGSSANSRSTCRPGSTTTRKRVPGRLRHSNPSSKERKRSAAFSSLYTPFSPLFKTAHISHGWRADVEVTMTDIVLKLCRIATNGILKMQSCILRSLRMDAHPAHLL